MEQQGFLTVEYVTNKVADYAVLRVRFLTTEVQVAGRVAIHKIGNPMQIGGI
jgi:hypothetical protein